MKKIIQLITGTLCVLLLGTMTVLGQIHEPDGLRLPGDWNGFTNTNGMGGDFDLNPITLGGVKFWTTTFEFTGTTGTQNFKFVSGGDDPWANQWTLGNYGDSDIASMNSSQTYNFHSNSDPAANQISVTNGNWYTVKWKDIGYQNTDAIFMETSAEPVDINSVSLGSTSGGNFTVNITLSGSKSAEENIYVRYSDDSFSTSKHVLATGSSTSYSASIPATHNTQYYILSTTIDLGTDNSTYSGDYDMVTINLNNNSGSNYHYYTVDLTTAAGFRLLSSPSTISYETLLTPIWTQGATAGADTEGGDPNVFTWDKTSTDTANTNWDGVTDLSGNIEAGNGFLIYVFADDDFDKSADGWPKTLSIAGTENAVDTSPTLNTNTDGLTLVGNPFATTIDFDNVTTSELTDAAYVWDPNEGAEGSWKSYTKGDGGAGDITDGLIAPFQGFFVQNDGSVTSPSITFGSASKSTGGSFLGKEQNEERAVARLELEGNDLRNSMWIQFSEEGSAQKQIMGDALEFEALSESYAQLALQKENTLYDIAHLPFTESEYSLPLSMRTTAGGTYTLKATDFEIPSNLELIFHDYETGRSEPITGDFSVEVELPAAKVQNVPTLKRIQQAPVLAKGSDTNRYGISVRSKSATSNEPTDAPEQFTLEQNYPNPFNPTTSIQYSVAEAGDVSLTVYNVMGQRVETLVSGTKAAGTYRVSWDAANMASGIYYYRLHAAGQVLTRQMTLIK